MTFRPTMTALAAAALLSAMAPAFAQSNAGLDEMREELRKLRAEIETLKKEKSAAGLSDRVDALEIKSKDAVVAGDNAGSFRLPGSETSVRVYGYAEAHLIQDLGKPGPSDYFTDLMSQPLDSDSSVKKGRSKLTASTSRFGFESSTPTGAGSFSTKVEADFYSYSDGNRNRLRLRHAYGEYAGWLVGQTWSTFMDLDDLPETVDFNGPIGSPFSRRTMIRYTWGDAKAGYKLTGALEDPESGARVPNVVLRADKSFDWGAVNLRLLSHEKRSGGESKRGYGVGVGGSYKLTDAHLLMAQFARVTGDYDMMYGSTGYMTDSTTGKLLFDKNDGLVVGWAYTHSSALRGNLAIGLNRSHASDAYVAESKAADWEQSKRLLQVHVGAIYTPIKNVELGAEYIRGLRKTFAGETGTLSRIDLMGRYSF
ncbi:MAG TPA: DcaP family trimeric outer membrane transporter [Burkholderiaceae bacterium]|nr:DcaP family trimeric outer membrane transporter [Burkholderiaceae bacterium]HMY99733.1 DcaP family trimeric outer membrane transporter [Burkholderiaceae bacterium]HNB45307.1 DcaP family trimeric outer membrane transporter [Burkholderiaceae bacterium]HNG79579.1 DcaP family trimeric outer membrane transporter [Burkholderiaceae bacterium]